MIPCKKPYIKEIKKNFLFPIPLVKTTKPELQNFLPFQKPMVLLSSTGLEWMPLGWDFVPFETLNTNKLTTFDPLLVQNKIEFYVSF